MSLHVYRSLMGINNFDIGGEKCHVLLKWNTKLKINDEVLRDNLPRLVCMSGKTPEDISSLTEEVYSDKLDEEHVNLLHVIFRETIFCHMYRGYTIASKSGELKSSYKEHVEKTISLVLAFGNFGESWRSLCQDLLCIPIFAAAVRRIQNILNIKGINTIEVIQGYQFLPERPLLYEVLGNMVLQVGIIDILKDLEVVPDIIMGYTFGELSCAYFDGSLSLEQTVLMSYEMGIYLHDINKLSSTYLVKLSEPQLIKLLPDMIKIIWTNSPDSVTISGDKKITQEFVTSLKSNGIDAFEICFTSVNPHPENMAETESTILPKLKNIIVKSKQRSNKWLSSSTEAVSSPEYFLKALHSQVCFQDLSPLTVKNAVILEVGLGAFSELLKHKVERSLNIVKFDVDSKENGAVELLDVLGRLYEYGVNPQIQKLYPEFKYPVDRETPNISPKIRWKLSKDYHVTFYIEADSPRTCQSSLGVPLKADEWQFVGSYVIDGTPLFPVTGYFLIVWETISLTTDMLTSDLIIVFEDCTFNRATHIGKAIMELNVMIQRNSGNFELTEGGTDVVSGRVHIVSEDKEKHSEVPLTAEMNKSGVQPLETKELQDFEGSATKAWIKWDGNLVTFLDNMMQVKVLQMNTRLLNVPTGIAKMTIDVERHLKYVESFGSNPILPVYIYKAAAVLKCGGIEIRGLKTSPIARRKAHGQPVLEKNEFVPNELYAPLEQSLRINMQIALENLYAIKIKVVEILDGATKEESEPLAQKIFEIFGDHLHIHPSIKIFSNANLEMSNVIVEDKKLTSENGCHIIVGSRILERAMVLKQAYDALEERGFILSREDVDFDVSAFSELNLTDINVFTVHKTGSEKLIFIGKCIKHKELFVINVSEADVDFTWMRSLQSAMKSDSNVIIYSQNEDMNDLMGLFNCIRREPGGMNVRCFLIYGEELPPFDPNHPFYMRQISKNMAVNVYKGGEWGTYRHLLLQEVELMESAHCFVNLVTRGDTSSLSWNQEDPNSVLPPEKILIDVYYASLNSDVIAIDRRKEGCGQGFEFSGREKTGRRVMGIMNQGSLSTIVDADMNFIWEIPDYWTMEQASTIPLVYLTVIYAFIEKGKIKRGDSVLVNSGTGTVGQAAINLALAYGCTVFTTVGTPEKRELINKLFPQLLDGHIYISRDLTFEQMVKRETKGRGVDLVLNSLEEEKLLASVRCLARGGKFLELGKFDLANNNRLEMLFMEKECSFHDVKLDQMFKKHPSQKKRIGMMLSKGIEVGAVRPLYANVFKMDEIEQASRFMATGKHTGKVVIQIRREEIETKIAAPVVMSREVSRFFCKSNKSYIITGGLGGFGLELADWLILRAAKNVVLTSRTGIRTEYQSYRLNMWRSYGATVSISRADISSREGCEELISEAQNQAPIESIFHLAEVLKDSILDNQSTESTNNSMGPITTKYLDEITREWCPELRDFVVFSSISCERNNTSQRNYGMGKSLIRRICEQRRRDRFPTLVIEWGADGDVGLVAEMLEEETEMEIDVSLHWISNCLGVMDTFLKQKEATVVSSMLVVEKKSEIEDGVARILGIKEPSVSPHASLFELGMDSMTALELEHILKKELGVHLTPQDMRSLTFARLRKIQQSNDVSDRDACIIQLLPTGIEHISRYLEDQATSTISIIRLPSLVEDNSNASYVFCFPGIESFATIMKPMAANVAAKVFGIQFCYKHVTHSYKDLALEFLKEIENYLKPGECLSMMAYSWGSIIALETMALMEQKGYKGTLTIIDNSAQMSMEIEKNEFEIRSEAEFETEILCYLIELFLPHEVIIQNREKIYKCSNFVERCDVAYRVASKDSVHGSQRQRNAAIAFCALIKELRTHSPEYCRLKSAVRLFKPSSQCVFYFEGDDNLSDLCANLADLRVLGENNVSIFENRKAIDVILGVKTPATNVFEQQAKGAEERTE